MHYQKIYFGAPGTGKSHKIDEDLKGVHKSCITRVVIHPEFSYSDFVGQLLPEHDSSGHIEFKFKRGPFTEALVAAFADQKRDIYLVIEELSRGNVAAIFGDLFQLLDRDGSFRSVLEVTNANIANEIPTLVGNDIYLPSNFNILCTVNLNDQNVNPMDTAFKRRFEWEYISTVPANIPETNTIDSKLNNPKLSIVDNSVVTTTWQSFYMALNSFILDKTEGLGRREDKQVGQFFILFDKKIVSDSHSSDSAISSAARVQIDNIIKNKLLMYLWQDVQGYSRSNGSVSLFSDSINSYQDLYTNYGEKKVFSDEFINGFLIPNATKYPY